VLTQCRRTIRELADSIKDGAEYEHTRLIEMRIGLHRNILAWVACQEVYMPEVRRARALGNSSFTLADHDPSCPASLPLEPMDIDGIEVDDELALELEDLGTCTCARRLDSPRDGANGAARGDASRTNNVAPTSAFPMPAHPDSFEEGILDVHDAANPELIRLMLPSALPADRRATICPTGLIEVERRFRIAQMDDALVRVRKGLQVFAVSKSEYKGELSAGTKHGTKARTLLKGYWTNVTRAATQYRVAWDAMWSLDPDLGEHHYVLSNNVSHHLQNLLLKAARMLTLVRLEAMFLCQMFRLAMQVSTPME
jgi:hypothetical protein